jgi:hypothetical protein
MTKTEKGYIGKRKVRVRACERVCGRDCSAVFTARKFLIKRRNGKEGGKGSVILVGGLHTA